MPNLQLLVLHRLALSRVVKKCMACKRRKQEWMADMASD